MDYKNLSLSNVSLQAITHRIVTNGLKLYLDAGNSASYPGTGSNWTDLSGEGYTGNLHAGVTYSADHGGSMVFDGSSNSFINLPSGFGYDYSAGITVNVWAKFATASAPWERLIDFGNGNPANNIIMARDNDTDNFIIDIEGINIDYATTAPTIDWDQWTMYTLWADGTNWKVYKNAMFQSYMANGSLPLTVTRSLNYIGLSNWGGDATFNGAISVVQLYNRALSEAELLENYQYFVTR